MKHPFWWALVAGLAVLLAAFAPPLWQAWRIQGAVPAGVTTSASAGAPLGASPSVGADLPWQVAVLPDGTSRVLGLHLGRDRLAEAQARFGDRMQLAVVARIDETGRLEALVDPMNAGFVSGRLVIGFAVPAELISRWRSQAGAGEPMGGAARRFQLRAAEHEAAQAMPIESLTLVPAVRLTADDVRERFGPPGSVLTLADQAQVMRYPERGLQVTVQPGQRGVLQYVAPGRFHLLAAGLSGAVLRPAGPSAPP